MKRYDYIIAGAGCAGLSLVMYLIGSGRFAAKKILLVDRAPKIDNDRTWCFWEEGAGLFEPVVSARWSQLEVHFPGYSKPLDIAPYEYKMIRGDDFYAYCFESVARHKNVEVAYGNIEALESNGQDAVLTLSGEQFAAQYIFSSTDLQPFQKQRGAHYLLQHFKGWMVEMDAAMFNPDRATLMDFRIPQTHGTSFVYVLPLSPTTAMIEATLFSAAILEDGTYQEMLEDYLSAYYPDAAYRITATETGRIPMTSHRFPEKRGRIIYLGTAGGQTKASTGYTFMPIQKHCKRLTAQLAAHGHPYSNKPVLSRRFGFYDALLLRLLEQQVLPGAAIFERLFWANKPQKIFRFLDNETAVWEDVQLTLTLQKRPFIQAALRELFR